LPATSRHYKGPDGSVVDEHAGQRLVPLRRGHPVREKLWR
jgi:hypothetical protein